MPRGRPVNLDKRIAELVGQLKAALVARSRQQIEAQVDSQVASLVGGLERVVQGNGAAAAVEVAVVAPATGQGNRKPRSAASRAAQAAKMKAYWAKRKAGKGSARPGARRAAKATPAKGGAWASMTSEQRAERIARMKAGRARA